MGMVEEYLRCGGPLVSDQLYDLEMSKFSVLSAEKVQELGRSMELWVKDILDGVLSYDHATGHGLALDAIRSELQCFRSEPMADGTRRGRRYVEQQEYENFCLLQQWTKEQQYLIRDTQGYAEMVELLCYTITRRCIRQVGEKLQKIYLNGSATHAGELHDTLRKAQKSDKDIVQTLTCHNLRLVRKYAKEAYKRRRPYLRGLDLEDFIQEGNMGLLDAIDHFDYRLGNHFSTFTTFAIRQKMIRLFENHSQNVRLPADQQQLRGRYAHLRNKYHAMDGEDPSPEYLAEQLRQPLEIVRKLAKSHVYLALNSPVNTDDGLPLEEVLSDGASTPEQEQGASEQRETIQRAMMHHLTLREEVILCHRYGLQKQEEKTLEQLGEQLGVTRERVRQLQMQAERKLGCSKELEEVKNF